MWACLWAETLLLLLSTPVHLFLVSSLSAANTPACHQLVKPPTTETWLFCNVLLKGCRVIQSFKSCESLPQDLARGGWWGLGVSGVCFFFTECVCRGPRAPWCSAAAPGWRAAGRSRCTSYPSALPSGSCCRGKTVRGRKRCSPPIPPMQAVSFESTQTTARREKKLYWANDVHLRSNSKTVNYQFFYFNYCCKTEKKYDWMLNNRNFNT